MRKYCGNISQLEFFIHYIIFPFPSFHFIHSLHTLSFLIPIPLLLSYPYPPSFLSSSSFNTALILSFFLKCSLSVFYLFIYLFLLDSSALILSFFFSNALSLFFFFFLLDSSALILSFFFFFLQRSFFYLILERGIMAKVLWEHFLPRLFLLIWEDEICGPERENFLSGFPPFLFSLACQIVENTVFLSIFLPMFSIPLNLPQPNTVLRF